MPRQNAQYQVLRLKGLRRDAAQAHSILVQWKGYTEETWEPAATLCKDVPELIKTFARNPRLLDSKTRPLLPGLLQVFCTSRRSPLTRLKQQLGLSHAESESEQSSADENEDENLGRESAAPAAGNRDEDAEGSNPALVARTARLAANRAALEALLPASKDTSVFELANPGAARAKKAKPTIRRPRQAVKIRTSRRNRGLGPDGKAMLEDGDAEDDDDGADDAHRQVKSLKLLTTPEPYKMVPGRLSVDEALMLGNELATKTGAANLEQGLREERKFTRDDLKRLGWSDARIKAYMEREGNPNAYYYRFNAPGEGQATGGWTVEEHDRFMGLIKHGVDHRWGLLSIKVPGRVGYQCANYYNKLRNKGLLKGDELKYIPPSD